MLLCHFLHLARATWHTRASVSVIHREAFPSNSITVSAATPDIHPARKTCLLPQRRRLTHRIGSARHRRYQRNIQSPAGITWFILSIPLQRHPTDDFMSKSILKLGRWGFGRGSWYSRSRWWSEVFLFMEQQVSTYVSVNFKVVECGLFTPLIHLHSAWISLFHALFYFYSGELVSFLLHYNCPSAVVSWFTWQEDQLKQHDATFKASLENDGRLLSPNLRLSYINTLIQFAIWSWLVFNNLGVTVAYPTTPAQR